MPSAVETLGAAPLSTPLLTPASYFNTEQYFSAITPHTEVFEASSGVVHMAVNSGNMWIALANGGIEVREVHTAILQHTFSPAPRPSSSTRVWSILSIRAFPVLSATLDYPNHNDARSTTEEPQVWVGLSSGTIEVYHGLKYVLLHQLRKHMSGVYCLESCDSRSTGYDDLVFSGSSDFLIAQWRVSSGQLVRIFKGHSNYVRCLYAEGTILLSGSDDRSIRVWDRDSGETLRIAKFHAPTGGVSAMCRVGVKMWSGDDSGGLVIWHIRDCVVGCVSRPHTMRITSLQKVGSRVYSASADGTIGFYYAQDGTLLQRLSQHAVGGSRVMMVRCAVEVDRHYIWSCGTDKTVRCWHHDEPIPMSKFQERLNDMRWYHATQRPHRESNEKLLDAHETLSEWVLLYQGKEDDIRAFLDSTDLDKHSTAAKCWDLDSKLREANRLSVEMVKERSDLEAQIEEKRKALHLLKNNLEVMTEALANARTNSTGVRGPLNLAAPVPVTAPSSQGMGPAQVEAPALVPTVRFALSKSYEAPLPDLPPPPLSALSNNRN